MIKIGIVESNALFSKSYDDFFSTIEGYEIAFNISTVNELLQLTLVPGNIDVLIIDFGPEEPNKPDPIKYIKKQMPTVRVIVFTANSERTFTLNCLKNGADSYLLKNEGLFELLRAIKESRNNGLVISPIVARQMVHHVFFGNEKMIPLNFTTKEREIINHAKLGMSYKQMAGKLNVTPFTINHHLKKIYKKAGVNSRSQLMAQLQNFGL
ncbi:response regulator [soil metagenome]